jgi:hypothetical protein
MTRIHRRLHPRSPASWNVRRIIRRMRHDGGGTPPRDERGNRRPGTFLGIIGRVLQIRAWRRKVGRRPFPRHLRARR